jgi:hypothetical protein
MSVPVRSLYQSVHFLKSPAMDGRFGFARLDSGHPINRLAMGGRLFVIRPEGGQK